MKKDIKHTIALTQAEGAQQRCEALAKKMESDPKLKENAIARTGDVKVEKWWRTVSGAMLVAACLLYTFYLTIPAVIVAVLLVIFMVYVFFKLYRQRKLMGSAAPEITPNRSVETMIRKALGLSISGRDVSIYMNDADVAALGTSLKPALEAHGITGKNISVKSEAWIPDTTQLSDKCSRIPVTVLLTSGSTQVALKWDATFAMPATGDFMVDAKLSVKE